MIFAIARAESIPRWRTALEHNPVCGVIVEEPASQIAIPRGRYLFCSEECRGRFQTDPAHYLSQAA